jgi:hypothetical protein
MCFKIISISEEIDFGLAFVVCAALLDQPYLQRKTNKPNWG